MDEKVYTPVVIPDAPFPTQSQQPQASTSPSSGGVYTHQQIPDTPMPTKIIAHEVMNNVLNTKSRKILAEFQFTKSGAIQIGDFSEGKHGDIKISPDGITARNVKGETTFAIDGDTGDAVFRGTVQVGDFEEGQHGAIRISSDGITARNVNGEITFAIDGDAGDAIFKGTVQGKDFNVIDENGLLGLNVFASGNNTKFGSSYGNSSQTESENTDARLSFTLERESKVLILLSCTYYMDFLSIPTFTVNTIAIGQIDLGIDGSPFERAIYIADNPMGTSGLGRTLSGSYQTILTLPAGSHTISLWAKKISVELNPGNATIVIPDFSISYIILGN